MGGFLHKAYAFNFLSARLRMCADKPRNATVKQINAARSAADVYMQTMKPMLCFCGFKLSNLMEYTYRQQPTEQNE